MSLKYRPPLQILLAVCLIIAGLPKEFRAQIKLFARVQPNKERINISAEIYDPASSAFTAAAGPMFSARTSHTATRLPNGRILITGGHDGLQYLSTAEIFDPLTGTSAETTKIDPTTSERVASSLVTARQGHTATLLQNGMVLIVGGYNGTYLNSAELYNPATGVFSLLSSNLATGRAYHTATLQFDGQVLIAGGYNNGYLNSLELYNPSTRTFTQLSPTLGSARAYHSATRLSDGKVLIAGGYDGTNYLGTGSIYDPSDMSVQPIARTMTTGRDNHTATLLPDGKVIIAGGFNGSALATAEIFDPAAGSFTAVSSQMSAPRQQHTATLLDSGKVMIAGGGNGSPLAAAEIYDPSTQKFSAIQSPMIAARQNHTATLLKDGRVLLEGGQNADLLVFDVNADSSDNVAPNIVFTGDSKRGVVSYTGSGTVLIFSAVTGKTLNTIATGGEPTFITPLSDGHTLAIVSAFDNRIFLIDTNTSQLTSTLTFSGAEFGFGSIVTVAHNSNVGFVSSEGTGEVIKFSLPDGKVLGRLGGLSAPSQLTITPDDRTLIVVDPGTTQLIFVDPSTMQKKTALDAKNWDPDAAFTICNNIALSADGSTGIIASRGQNADHVYTVYIFSTSTASVEALETMTNAPGYAALTPDGQNWVILGADSLLVVPTANPDGKLELSSQGEPLISANIVFSPDSKYAYYTSATSDYFLKQNLSSLAVEGHLNLGDDPNVLLDQSATVAETPDGQTFAALNFVSNNIALITLDTLLVSSKFVSGPDPYTEVPSFTSLCLINTSDSTANIQISAVHDYGSNVAGTGITNPVTIALPPNGQISATVDQLFGFDGVAAQAGWLSVVSDIPEVVGYVSAGQVQGSWLGPTIRRLDGVPLVRDPLHDWIVPEVSRETGRTTELNFLNPYYSSAAYNLSSMTADGSSIEDRTDVSITSAQRISQSFTAVYTQTKQGQVLIAGGQDATTTLSSAEVYDPTGLIFNATAGTMNRAVQSQMATVLSSSKVLTAGGKDSSNNIVNYAEVYDPVSGAFTVTTGAMNTERYRGTATLLQDGRVLIAGGQTSRTTSNTAELYDATASTFSYTPGTMASARDSHTATLLANGKVLIAGGSDGNQVLDTAELFDPSTGTFAATGKMTAQRAFHTATLLSDGKVLIAGGYNGSYLSTAEIYDPSTGTFTAAGTSMIHARSYHTSTLLSDGRVLLTGGTDGSSITATAELYDPEANAFLPTSQNMSTARQNHAAVRLASTGSVLILGGTDGTNVLKSAELYDPSMDAFSASSNSMTSARKNFTATMLPGGTEAYLRVTSTQGLMFSEFYGNASSLAALNGIDMSKYSGITSLFSPQFATVSGFTTLLNVINGNTNPAGITITLYDQKGNPIGNPATLTLPPGAQLKGDIATIFQHDPAIQNVTGWLEVDSTVDLVVGTISFTNASGSFLSSFELQGTPLADFILPLAAIDSTYHTAMALLNPGGSTASVDVELWAQDGTMTRAATLNLAPGSRTSLYLDQVFPNLGSVLVSNIRIHSTLPLFAFSLIHDSGLNFMASMPPIAFPPSR
jgi:hypothetical protein